VSSALSLHDCRCHPELRGSPQHQIKAAHACYPPIQAIWRDHLRSAGMQSFGSHIYLRPHASDFPAHNSNNSNSNRRMSSTSSWPTTRRRREQPAEARAMTVWSHSCALSAGTSCWMRCCACRVELAPLLQQAPKRMGATGPIQPATVKLKGLPVMAKTATHRLWGASHRRSSVA
jgi:hypothetical protein